MAEKKLSKADQQVVEDEQEAEELYQKIQKDKQIAKEESAPTPAIEPLPTIGGMTLAACARCGKEIGLDDSFEVLPPDYQRVHRPRCEV